MPRSARIRAVGLLSLLLALAALPLLAQSQVAGGEIVGTVIDETGGVLPGVTVTIRNQATGVSRDTQTDERGRYRAPLLPVGSYEVSAVRDGNTRNDIVPGSRDSVYLPNTSTSAARWSAESTWT